MKNKKINAYSAFTIVELLVVIVVIAILAAISFVAYNGVSSRAVASSLKSDLEQASKQIKMYQVDNGYLPSGLEPNTNCLRDSVNVADTDYCLKASSGASFSYIYNGISSPLSFDLLLSKNGIIYHVTDSISPELYNVPSAPQSLTAIASGSLRINLSWTAPNSDSGSPITAYKIYRGISSGSESWMVDVGNVTSYSDMTANPNTTYYYKILAINANGNGQYSNESNAQTAYGGIDSYTKLILHGDDLTDSATTPKIMTNNNVIVSSAQGKFGGKSLSFNGASYLKTPDASDWDFGTEPFTYDAWVKGSSGGGTVIAQGGTTTVGGETWGIPLFNVNGSGYIFIRVYHSYTTKVEVTGTTYIDPSVWTHIAMVRDGSSIKTYVNGVLDINEPFSNLLVLNSATTYDVYVGAKKYASTTDGYYTGFIDELRVSKGIARWTSNFTPPTQPYTN